MNSSMLGSLLAWVTLLPLLGAILVMVIPKEEEALHRGVGLAVAIATFVMSLFVLTDFESSIAGFQLVVMGCEVMDCLLSIECCVWCRIGDNTAAYS